MSQLPSDLKIQRPPENLDDATGPVSRRAFLGAGGLAAAAALGGVGLGGASPAHADEPPPADGLPQYGPLAPDQRAKGSFRRRVNAARVQLSLPLEPQFTNGDEALYPNRIANYSKGLPHDDLGEVEPAAYDALVAATSSGLPAAFEAIPLGCGPGGRKLVNPQAGLAFDLEGCDGHRTPIPPAPAFASAENAGEAVELYWMALARDVPFAEYDRNPITLAAAADLSALSDFRGPKDRGGQVTTATLFRGDTPGDRIGPFVSQFLYLPTPFGAEYVERRMRTVAAGVDYMTSYADWLAIQNGCQPASGPQYVTPRRYIVNARDLAEWVHIDVLFQAYFNAMLILLQPPDGDHPGIGAPLNPGNPYHDLLTQEPFGTFGGPHVATLVCEPATRALKAVWYQKWLVHRRLRPEVFGGRVHNHLTGAADYPIHDDMLNSAVLDEVYAKYGTYLLPQAFPEGSPLHPAYGAGHATVAGACVTMVKALFDNDYAIPNPVVPDPNDPTRLVPYEGPPLTVGNELDKLAANVAMGRNMAGIHWRTDYSASIRLGEQVTINLLFDQKGCYNEPFEGFTFKSFDGETVTV